MFNGILSILCYHTHYVFPLLIFSLQSEVRSVHRDLLESSDNHFPGFDLDSGYICIKSLQVIFSSVTIFLPYLSL